MAQRKKEINKQRIKFLKAERTGQDQGDVEEEIRADCRATFINRAVIDSCGAGTEMSRAESLMCQL